MSNPLSEPESLAAKRAIVPAANSGFSKLSGQSGKIQLEFKGETFSGTGAEKKGRPI